MGRRPSIELSLDRETELETVLDIYKEAGALVIGGDTAIVPCIRADADDEGDWTFPGVPLGEAMGHCKSRLSRNLSAGVGFARPSGEFISVLLSPGVLLSLSFGYKAVPELLPDWNSLVDQFVRPLAERPNLVHAYVLRVD